MIAPQLLCLVMLAATVGLLLSGFPVAFTLAGSAAAFAFVGYALGIFDLGFLAAFPQRIFAVMTSEVLVAVPLFVFMGVMLERSRVAEALLETVGGLFGRLPGGLAYAVSIVGVLLAASTGIVGATVVTMGLLSLPTMLARGYRPSFACGSVAACGTLGQIVPPSIVLVLLGDQLSAAYQSAQFERGIVAPDTVSVNDLFAGALIPGLMLVGLYLVYQMLFATARAREAPPLGDSAEPGQSLPTLLRALAGSLFAPLVLIVAVLGSILAGLASPGEAAGLGAAGALMLSGYRIAPERTPAILAGALCLAGLLILAALFDLRVDLARSPLSAGPAVWAAAALALGLAWGLFAAIRGALAHEDENGIAVLHAVMRATMMISAMIFAVVIGAAMFSLVFRGLRGDVFIAGVLAELPGGALGAVFVVMAVMFVLGFFLDFLEIVFIVVPIVAPVLLQMEVAPGVAMSPVWLGVMMGMVLQTSFLTPPFGLALFYLRGVAPARVRTVDIYRGIAPFVLIQLLALAVIWYLPQLATWLPLAVYGR